MSNNIPASALVAKAALPILKNNLAFTANANREWEAEWESNSARGYKAGQTINILKPPRYGYRAGATAVPQDSVMPTVPLTVNQGGCDLFNTRLDSTVLTTKTMDQIGAGMAAVANEIDRQGLELAKFATYNLINPTGAAPTTSALAFGAITDVGARLDEMSAPRDGKRIFVMSPRANGQLVTGLGSTFNNQQTLSKQFSSGLVENSLGIAYGMGQNVAIHTNGAATATNVNGAGQTGSNIAVIATAGGTLTKGTVIQFPGVFAVNAQTRLSTGSLADFVVTSDVLVGSTTLPISPAIVTSGNFQNVTASPTTGAVYTIRGAVSTSYSSNIACHRNAFTLAMVPMASPPAGTGAISHTESEDGLILKVTEYWDGANDIGNMRIDVLFGWAATYPELSTKFYTL